MELTQFVLSIITGLVTILLATKLVEYVRKAKKEKNWDSLLELVMKFMEQAEEKFVNGADRKQWVMVMVKIFADTINYDVDMNVIGDLIDNLCAMSKQVNNVSVELDVGET